MLTKTAYRRPSGFGATKASIKAGLRYEEKVGRAVLNLVREAANKLPDVTDVLFKLQSPRYAGFVDIEVNFPGLPRFFIEVKSQWSEAAYKQILYYAGEDVHSISRVCICKVHHPHIPIPEAYECLPLDQLLTAQRGRLTIIPWSGRT